MTKARWAIPGAAALALLCAAPAYAHDQKLDLSASFHQGFLHPITGPDHLIAMVAVGLVSGVLGGRAVLTVPALFVAYLLIGGVFGFEGVELIGVELWILGSLVLLGVVLARGAAPRRTLMIAAVAFFGFAHGNAHGARTAAGVERHRVRGRLRARQCGIPCHRRPARPRSDAHAVGTCPGTDHGAGHDRRRRVPGLVPADGLRLKTPRG